MPICRVVVLVLCLLLAGTVTVTAGEKNYKQLYREGVEHYRKGEFDEAVRLYSKAIALRPNSVIMLFRRGCAYEKIKQYDKAISDLDKAIALEPEYSDAFYVRGLAYLNQGRNQPAQDDFKKACALGFSDACGQVR